MIYIVVLEINEQVILAIIFVYIVYRTVSYVFERSPIQAQRNRSERFKITSVYIKLINVNACISGFPRGATPGVPPGTEGRLLRLSGNFIPGVAGIDSLLTIYGLHPRADPGDLFGQRLNLQKNVARDKMAERKASSFYVFYFLSICSHLSKQTICIFSLYGWMLKVRSPRRDTQTRKFRVSRLQKLKSFECLDRKN